MKRNLINWIAVFISLLPLIYLAIIWPSLPAVVPLHYGADMKPDRMGSKTELWLVQAILVTISIGVYFLFRNLHRFDPKRKNAVSSTTFTKIGFGMVVFIAAINFLILSSVKTGAPNFSLLFPLVGLLFAFIGYYMNNIKPNYFAGFRLPWTLNSDRNWRKTHHLGSNIWFAGGMLIAIVCLFLPFKIAFIFFFGVVAVMVLIPLVYSYRLFKKEATGNGQ